MRLFVKKIIAFVLVVLAVTGIFAMTVSAAPIESYTNWDTVDGDKQAVYCRDMYRAVDKITAATLGISESLSEISDMYCASNGNIYLLCGGDSRIVILNSDYSFVQELEVRNNSGETIKYKDAKGIYVDDDGVIYLCDTQNERVLIIEKSGLIIGEYTLPDSEIIPNDFIFQPTKIVRDSKGYTYILSLGSYYGAILYSPENEFLGFYGANTVQATVLDTLSYLWELLTSNDEKKSQEARSVPYAFVDICADEEGFIYTCTGNTSSNAAGYGQIRMLSPGGDVILYKRDFNGEASVSSGYNFLETDLAERLGVKRSQNLVSIEVSSKKYIYALDSTYGRIYLYDSDCNLLSTFGGGTGAGIQLGTFQNAVCMTLNGDEVLVADSKKNSITIFKLTEYGKIVLEAQQQFIAGEYASTKEKWQKVLGMDGNSLLAYRGLAKVYYAENNMEKAIEYSRIGKDYVTYDQAHKYQVTKYVKENFIWIFCFALLIIAGLTAFLIYVRKRETALIKNSAVSTATSVIFHPFRAFSDLKYRNYGSVAIACIMLFLLFITTALKFTASGFLFNKNDASTYNVIYTFAQTVGLIILWSISNWAVCTIFSGKGKLKEVFIASAYSMMPLIIYNVLFVILSHILPLSSVSIINSIYTVVIVFTFFIFCIGIMTVHEYSFPRFLITALATVVAMFLIVFVIFIVVILIQQFADFLYALFMEVVYR